jgi:hypothetical protein
MNANVRTIEVDSTTAEQLEAREAERGQSISELLANLIGLVDETRDEQLAELDRRRADYLRTGESYDHADVERWLKTVGTDDYRSFDEFRAALQRR